MTFVTSAFIVTWIALLLMGLALSGVIRQVRHLSAHGGTAAPRPVTTTARRRTRIAGLDVDVPLLLLLVDGSCQVCTDRIAELRTHAQHHAGAPVGFAVASRSALDVDAPELRVYEHADDVFAAMGPRMLPHGAVLDPSGLVVAETAVGSPQHLEQLTTVALEQVEVTATREVEHS